MANVGGEEPHFSSLIVCGFVVLRILLSMIYSMIILKEIPKMSKERITVTLPKDIVRDIDRREKNRSKFILQAVKNELNRQRREELRLSLRNPHPESKETAELGMDDWIGQSNDGDEDLLDPNVGRAVQWSPGKGWSERKK